MTDVLPPTTEEQKYLVCSDETAAKLRKMMSSAEMYADSMNRIDELEGQVSKLSKGFFWMNISILLLNIVVWVT